MDDELKEDFHPRCKKELNKLAKRNPRLARLIGREISRAVDCKRKNQKNNALKPMGGRCKGVWALRYPGEETRIYFLIKDNVFWVLYVYTDKDEQRRPKNVDDIVESRMRDVRDGTVSTDDE